jgi:hypothetical protein
MSKFGNCPRAWYLSEYLGLQPNTEVRVGPLPFGSRVHVALEIWGKSGWKLPIEQIWNRLVERERSFYEELGWGWGVDQDKENRMGHAMLTGYVEWLEEENQLQDWEVVAIESKHHMPLSVTLPSGEDVEIVLASKLDLVERHNPSGALFVDDYKTAQSLEADAIYTTLEQMQGKLYALQLKAEDPDRRVDGVIFTILRKVQRGPRSKPPYYKRIVLPLTPHTLHAAKTNAIAQIVRMIDTANRLDAGQPHWSVAPYQVSWQCRSCPFRAPCELMRDGRMKAAQGQLDDMFHVGDPLARYAENDPLALVGDLV